MTERSHVEKLADEAAEQQGQCWNSIWARRLRAAIEADCEAGWINTAENYMFLHNLIAERDRFWAEVERLRAEVERLRAEQGRTWPDNAADWTPEAWRRQANYLRGRLETHMHRAERAEAEVEKLRAYCKEWKASNADLGERLNKAEYDRDEAEWKFAEVRELAEWHETKASKALRYRPEASAAVMDKAAEVHRDAARRLRAVLDREVDQ